MRDERALPCRVSGSAGKLKFVELSGASSTREALAPILARSTIVYNRGSGKAGASGLCCVRGLLNGRPCSFRIDTGADVLIITRLAVPFRQDSVGKGEIELCYPTGEEVPIRSKLFATVSLGKFRERLTLFVAAVEDDCIRGVDFLSRTGALNLLRDAFDVGLPGHSEKRGLICFRVRDRSEPLPLFLNEVLERGSTHLNSRQQDAFREFLTDFRETFAEEVVAGSCTVLNHRITLSDPCPIKQAPRRIPLHLRAEVGQILEDMKKQGVIEESSSPWMSPAVMVKKKDGSIRFCVDYPKLSAVTVKDSYPLPRIDEILDQLAGNAWFTTIDLKSGYWPVSLAPRDREKTAFSIANGLWQFTVMPFFYATPPRPSNG